MRDKKMNFTIWSVLLLLFCVTTAQAAEDARDSNSPFGMLEFLAFNHKWNNYHYDTFEKIKKSVQLMKEAGVRFVRIDFTWTDIEKTPGQFDFDKHDRIVELLSKNKIRISGLLAYSSTWGGTAWNAPPDLEAFVRYAQAVVRHYKDRVKYWEIWNEPDTAIYWTPQDQMKTYTLLLKEVYPALKKEDPTCVILIGGLTDVFSLKRVYQYGGKDYFDVVNIHPFVNPLLGNSFSLLKGIYQTIYKIMKENGDADKPIWFTELGCPGISDPKTAKGWWGGKSPLEEEQAAWVTTVYGEPLHWKGVKKIFWAFFRDTTDNFHNDVDHFGLLRNDFSKKPSYEAYRRAAGVIESKA